MIMKTDLDKVFLEKYKGLNRAQKEAVDSIEGPVMVIAGPGTGKTTILTLRIANILRKTDTPPSGILALTFTDSGVKAMRKKLREIIGSLADEVLIYTFHSFASSIISEFPEHFTDIHRSTQITDVESEEILRDILKNKKYSKLRPIGDVDFYLQKIISSISDAKKEAWSPEDIKIFANKEIDRIKQDPSEISTKGASKGQLKADALKKIEKCERTILFADVYKEYEEKKKVERKIDFDDLLIKLLDTLKKDELLLRLIQEKFLYILVDEHQDTNDSQNLIVSHLANFFETPNLFVVGDEKQAIYRFQGASVENFLKFQSLWKDMKVISLEENYRSHQDILDAVFQMIEKNYDEEEHKNLRVELKSKEKNKKPLDLVFAKDILSADVFLVDELKKISKEDPSATVAVILRWNRDIDHILSLCEKNGITISAERGADIFHHPLGVLFFKILDFLVDPSMLSSLAFTLGADLWDLEFNKRVDLLKKIKSGDFSSLEKELPKLSILKSDLKKAGLIDSLILIGQHSGLTTLEKMQDPVAVEVWRGILDLVGDIAKSKKIEDLKILMQELLNYKKTSESKSIKIGVGSSDAKIQAMTAHSSKGLEYDYVFLPLALEENWMRKSKFTPFVMPKEKDDTDEIKDTRRLFYVALTRAKKHITIIVPEKDNLGNDLTSLRFINELHQDRINKIIIEKVKDTGGVLSGEALSLSKESELLEYAKRVLSEKGLSVTALNHFMKCPSEFLYKSILKIPEAPNSSGEKGNAMHKAMSEVWRSSSRSKKDIQKIIENTVNTYMSSSLLNKHDKEVVLEELIKDSENVAKELEEHFNISGKVFTDKWVSNEFVKEKLEIPLHGQLDVVLDTGKSILIFDYKTKQAMSENAIKGLTKSEDGGYWRQLVFYKLLLQKDYKDKPIEPALVFIKPDSKGRCPTVSLPVLQSDIDNLKKEIDTLVSSVYSGEFIRETCDDRDCEFCKLKNFSLGKHQ